MRRTKKHRVEMRRLLCQRARHVIKPDNIKFLYDDPQTQHNVFSILSPITDNELRFSMSQQAYYSARNSRGIHQAAAQLVDWRSDAHDLMTKARDVAPFREELRALDFDEHKKFSTKPRPWML